MSSPVKVLRVKKIKDTTMKRSNRLSSRQQHLPQPIASSTASATGKTNKLDWRKNNGKNNKNAFGKKKPRAQKRQEKQINELKKQAQEQKKQAQNVSPSVASIE